MKILSTRNVFIVAVVVISAAFVSNFFDESRAQVSNADSPWPTFRGDAGLRGQAKAAGPQIPDLPIARKLEQEVGQEMLSPILVNDSTLVYNFWDRRTIYIEHLKSGRQSKFDIRAGTFKAPPVAGKDDVIYVGSTAGWFYAINTADGTERWSLQPKGDDAITSSANVSADGGSIYIVTSGGFFCAYSKNEKRLIDPFPLNNFGPSVTPAIDDNDRIYVARGHKIYAFYRDGSSIQNLDSRMSHPNAGNFEWVVASSGLIFVGSKTAPFVMAFNADNGAREWVSNEQAFSSDKPPALSSEGRLYLLGSDNTLKVLDIANGNELPSINRAAFTSIPVSDALGRIYLAATTLEFFGFGPDHRELFRLSLNIDAAIRQSPAFGADGAIYIPGRGELYIVHPEPAFAKKFVRKAGDRQTGCVGSKLPLPLQVQVIDQYERPFPGQGVKFEIASGNGSVNVASASTDDNGIAQVEWILGSNLSEQKVVASIPARNDLPKLDFTAARLLPQIADSIKEISFDTTSTKDSTTQVYSIHNPGSCALLIQKMEVLGETPPSFYLMDRVSNALIAPRGSLPVRIKFRPKVHGNRLGVLRILSDASNQNQLDVKLHGYAWADTIPPQAPIQLSLAQGKNWQSRNEFVLMWMNPSDASGIDSAYYKIGHAPKSNHDRDVAWAINQFSPRINDVRAKMPGRDSLFVWLVDKFGNADYKKAAFVIIAFDNVQPRIETRLKTEARARRPATIEVETADQHSGIKTVEFYYRRGGMPEFVKSALAFLKSEITIPADSVTARGLEYYLVATDSAGNKAHFPREGEFHSIQVKMEAGELHTTHYGGELASDYRIRSFPLLLDDSTLTTAFGQDFGFTDPTFQRLWDIDPRRANSSSIFREFPQVGYPYSGKISPGRAMLLIARHKVTINSPKGYTARTDKPFAIPLHKGWNLVASPFSFPIPLRNSNLPKFHNQQFRIFQGTWNPVGLEAKFEPWEGLLLKVEEDDSEDSLFINPSEKVSDMMLKAGNFAHVAGADWIIRINAFSGDTKDIINTVGVALDAAPERDPYELLEPPLLPSGDNVRLYFSQSHWRHYRDLYTTDFRPPSAEGHEWRFQVQTNRRGKDVDLQFENIHALPAEWSVQLIDSVLNLPIDLRQQPFYSFCASEVKNNSRVFQLVIGNDQYVGKRLEKVLQTPSQFELLQNFPNPFNAVTMFRFGVPRTARVSLVIYNIKGETVRTLIDEQEKKAGPYAALWDGRDHNGNLVATGVYIYQLKAENFVLAKKMILAK